MCARRIWSKDGATTERNHTPKTWKINPKPKNCIGLHPVHPRTHRWISNLIWDDLRRCSEAVASLEIDDDWGLYVCAVREWIFHQFFFLLHLLWGCRLGAFDDCKHTFGDRRRISYEKVRENRDRERCEEEKNGKKEPESTGIKIETQGT